MLFKILKFSLYSACFSVCWSKSLLNLSFYLTCAISLYLWLLYSYREGRLQPILSGRKIVPAVLSYWGICLLSYGNTNDFIQFKDQFSMTMNWLYFLPLWYAIEKHNLKDKILYYLYFSILMGGILSLLWYLGLDFPGFHIEAGRFAPTSTGPVVFGMTGALSVVIALAQLLKGKEKLTFSILLLCGLISVFASGTKAAFLYFIPGIALLVVTTSWKLISFKSRVAISSLILLLVILGTYRIHDRLKVDIDKVYNWNPNQQEIASSLEYRFHTWYSALLIFRDNPLFGTGIGDYFHDKEIQIDNKIISSYFRHTRDSHSEYLENLATLGLVGTLFWIHLLFRLYKGCREDWIGRVSLFSFLFFGLTVPILRTKLGLVAFLLLMAATVKQRESCIE